ncbi:MAG: hypothetical protein LBG64_04480 [Pseudomonadales bacterium]|jgi:hypothetical protein|nr:hypothetical protein [Pseudomonadales bacterium]
MKLNIINNNLDALAANHPELADKVRSIFDTLPLMTTQIRPFGECLAEEQASWTLDSSDGYEGAFFKVPFIKVTNGPGISWHQPAIITKGEEVKGITEWVVGFVISLRDDKGNVLLLPANEPLKATNRALRPALQTSCVKLQAVSNGDTTKDPALAKLLQHIKLEDMAWEPADCAHDGNRCGGGVVLYSDVVLNTEKLQEFKTLLGGEIFYCAEIATLYSRARWVFNPHALATIFNGIGDMYVNV